MFVRRSPFHRNYKYSHPLAGTNFSNAKFLQHAQIQQNDNCSQPSTPTTHTTVMEWKVNQKRTKSKVMTQKKSKKKGEMHLRNSIGQVANKTWYGSNEAMNIVKQSITRMIETAPSGKRIRRGSEHCKLKRKHAINPFVDGYLFPTIQLHIIHKITSFEEISRNSFNYSFQKIFKQMISTQLMGEFTSNFMLKMEHYIRKIVQADEMYVNPMGIVVQNSYKNISRKNDLLDAIYQLQRQHEYDKIQEIIKFYCIPDQPIAIKMFNSLIDELTIQMYETRNCRKDMQYCLLTIEGHKISHISEIYFTTRQLYICPENHHLQHYHKYGKILEQHDKQQRMTFKESIKHDFVSRIVRNQVDNGSINYNSNAKEAEEYRKGSYQIAEEMLGEKSKLRLSRNGKAEMAFKELTPQDLSFSAPAFGRQTLYNSYMQRKFREKKQYKDFLKRMQKMLDPSNQYSLRSSLDKKVQQQFAQLHIQNDQYELNYSLNPDHSHLLLIKNIVENHILFKDKKPNQIEALTTMLNKIYNKGQSIKQLQFWQFKELVQSAHGVGGKETIMKYVLGYLPFDQYGEVSKKDMERVLAIAVGGQGRVVKMVGRIVWNWLERSKLVENGALRKKNIEIWYQPVKVVYFLMLSVMFGGEYQSLEEMFTDMVKYDYK